MAVAEGVGVLRERVGLSLAVRVGGVVTKVPTPAGAGTCGWLRR